MATPTTTAPAAPAAAAPVTQPGTKPAATTTPAPTPAEVRKMKLKLDGQDVEMSENEVIALAQQGKVSGKRFQEAADMRRQAEQIMKLAAENPKEFLTKQGKNARQWAEELLIEELKREAMTPEQKRAAENETKLKQYELEKKQAKEAADKADIDRKTEEHMKNFDNIFVEALGKSGLPKTPYTIMRMAQLVQSKNKLKLDVSADQLAKLVKEDYIAEQKTLFGALDGDQMIEFLGPELVKKLSKAQIAKIKAKGNPTAQAGSATAARGANSGEKTLTWQEYRKQNRRTTR